MPIGRPRQAVVLTREQRRDLTQIADSISLPRRAVIRAQLVLMAEKGLSNAAISRRLHLSPTSVGLRLKRYRLHGLGGLDDRKRSGRPPSIPEHRTEALIRMVRGATPKESAHWTLRSLAGETGLSTQTVRRTLRAFGLRLNRDHGFSISEDSSFAENVREMVGLYLGETDRAFVLCVDVIPHVQTLSQTHPTLPKGLGYTEGNLYLPKYVRRGTLLSSLNFANERFTKQEKSKKSREQFEDFLNRVYYNDVPSTFILYLVVDDPDTITYIRIKRWLKSRPRYHVCSAPTYSSWLSEVGRWFTYITQQADRRGTFTSVRIFNASVDGYLKAYGDHPGPFAWSVAGDSLKTKFRRLGHSIPIAQP